MTDYFTDSSALIKRYLNEIGSNWVNTLFAPQSKNEVFILALTRVEIIAAITRRGRGEGIMSVDARNACQQFRADCGSDYQIVEVNEALLNEASNLAERYGLRGYDAVQLAGACLVNNLCVTNGLPPLVFVSADNELNAAATQEGLKIENPNLYP